MLSKPNAPDLTVEALAKWLKTQPPEETYTWSDPVFCLLGRYLADNESAWGSAQYSDLPQYEAIAKQEPHSFGAALARAEQILALPKPSETPLEPTDISVPVKEPVAIEHHAD